MNIKNMNIKRFSWAARAQRRNEILDAMRLNPETSISDLSVRFKMSPGYIFRILSGSGLRPRLLRPAYPNVRLYTVIAALQNTADSYSEIARRLKVSRQRVSQIALIAQRHEIKFGPRTKHDAKCKKSEEIPTLK